MSRWCHVSASIFGITNYIGRHLDLICQTQEILAEAPKITGSEGNLDVFVNAISGYNIYSSSGERAQDEIVITLAGDLRDTDYLTVKNELELFLEFVKKKVFIEQGIKSNVAVINDEGFDKSVVLWV